MSTLKFEIESKTVSEFRNMNNAGTLHLQPKYQRGFVWPMQARVSLMETILLGFPIPEIYLAVETGPDGVDTTSVVDGQQRLTSLLNFVNDEYRLEGLESESMNALYAGKLFSELDDQTKTEFWTYRFPIRRLTNVSDDFVREVFARVNRVNMVLTEQEVRNAMLPGPFYDFLKDCATHQLAIRSGVFSAQRKLRGGDLEFFAEVFATCIFGISNKKSELDDRYNSISADFDKYSGAANDFISLLDSLSVLVKWEGRTRWSNIVDLFTLIHAAWTRRSQIGELTSSEGGLKEGGEDFRLLLDDIQKAISVSKRNSADKNSSLEDTGEVGLLVESLADRVDMTEAEAQANIEIYTSGVRNSSDLGSRRARRASLDAFLGGYFQTDR